MNEDIYKLLTENSTDVISRHTPEGIYLYTSPSTFRLLGYDPKELIGQNVFKLFHPDDLDMIHQASKKKMETHEAETSYYRLKTKNAGYIWVETISKVILDPETGEVVEIHASTRDVSQRVELTERLEEEQQLTKTAIESLPGIFYMLDEDRKYVLWNENLEAALDLEPGEIESTHPLEFYRKEDHEMISSTLASALEKGEAELEVDLISRKRRVRRYYLTARRIRIRGKVYVLGTGIDVTDRKRYEEALETSLQEKSVLLQEIHHRVKNNLAMISGLLTIQKYSVDIPEFTKVVTDCELRIKSMSLVHEKMYESSSLARVNFGTYLKELFATIQQIYDSSRTVTFRLHTNGVEMNINQAIPVALILNELITNSYKYAFQDDRSDKKIETIIREEDEKICIEMNDNGTGLPPGFDFVQASSMGFTIIRTLLDQLGAEIRFSSDQGTHIQITFSKVKQASERVDSIVL